MISSSSESPAAGRATLLAGVPAHNRAIYHRIRFGVGDPAAVIELPGETGPRRTLMVRDIEMDRARRTARADEVCCPADFAPAEGLSGDRETATAQATAQFLVHHQIGTVIADRTLPLVFAYHLEAVGITLQYDAELGVHERRSKDEAEVDALAASQQVTEGAMRMACEMVAQATARADGVLLSADGNPLCSEDVRAAIDIWLLKQGYTNPAAIVAGGTQGADCHELGAGPLRTGQPVIIDIFPCSRQTRYWGDCTRTVVHGVVPDSIAQMHAAVVEAKAAAIAATCAAVTGEQVHQAAAEVIREHGYQMGLSDDRDSTQLNDPSKDATMPHGTGHGVGLDLHEPPLLDMNGPPLVAGDVITIEPGLYSRTQGGIRIEDMVVVTPKGCRNLNTLPEGLSWG